jgi:uncharacterized protein
MPGEASVWRPVRLLNARFPETTNINNEIESSAGPERRTLPVLTPLNSFFWTSGRDGRLRILRCNACGEWLHPPGPVCPHCLSRDLAPREVSGVATVQTYTVNHQAWSADVAVPYIVAIVSLDDCPGVRLTTNLVGYAPADVRIGDSVRVMFERHQDVWLPLFTPLREP